MRKIIVGLCGMVCLGIAVGQDWVMPKGVPEGGTIAVVAPGYTLREPSIRAAVDSLHRWGYEVKVFPHALAHGSHDTESPYSPQVRADELMEAFADTTVDAIICTRGGYSTVQILPLLDKEIIRQNPKLLIGFSDISVLHSYLVSNCRMPGVHGITMGLYGIPSSPGKAREKRQAIAAIKNILKTGRQPRYELAGNPRNHPGKNHGILLGGNWTSIDGLISTPYGMWNPEQMEGHPILFMEDVGESIRSIERKLMTLHYSGMLEKSGGLVFGSFTDYSPEMGFATMEDMISKWLKEWGYLQREDFPVVFRFPAGHITQNLPLITGAPISLEVTADSVFLDHRP